MAGIAQREGSGLLKQRSGPYGVQPERAVKLAGEETAD
jgi:hypothetical protein